MSDPRTAAKRRFDGLIAELRGSIEEHGSDGDVLELDDLDFLEWAIAWTTERRECFGELEETEKALVAALWWARRER